MSKELLEAIDQLPTVAANTQVELKKILKGIVEEIDKTNADLNYYYNQLTGAIE